MDSVSSAESAVPPYKKPAKRAIGKHARLPVDSPAYDASEEDNEVETDDGGSTMSLPQAIPRRETPRATNVQNRNVRDRGNLKQHQLAASITSDSDAGVDSPTYDGDVESSATLAPSRSSGLAAALHTSASIDTTPSIEAANPLGGERMTQPETDQPVFISPPGLASTSREPKVPSIAKKAFNPASLTEADIQAFVQRAIEGEPWRTYKINPPPKDRPVRIYADGVYDLFHFGHALALRQAKLSFPSVYLLVGVNSDEQVRDNKAQGIMTHAERLEAVRHCRWVDEVVPDAPWVIDQAFIDKMKIDYVAHDEDPYGAPGHDDVYMFVKAQGKFIPTRRTPGVSTSELLERMVVGYRNRDFDAKLVKMGHSELRAEGSDYDESRNPSRNRSPVRGGDSEMLQPPMEL